MKIVNKYWGMLKHHFMVVLETKTSPHAIALGFAIGSFISILPTPFLNILIALGVVAVFEKVNKFSLFGSLFFWNPLTLAPLYMLSYAVGDLLFGTTIVSYELSLFDKVLIFSRRFLIGNIIVATISSILSYYVVKLFVINYRSKKQ